tara:strand:+ start:2676 stop:3932 length:1257 start_codon:yes stop_codon:yes gene_type:complete
MAQPFFKGNYGSALARVDTRPIVEAGRAQGAMYANLGSQVGGMIKEYGLNKQKRAKLTGEVEALYKEHPELLSQIGMSGDEAQDKKDITERERFVKGDMNMSQLEGYAGKLARGEVLRSKKLQDESRVIQNEQGRHNLGLAEEIKDSRVNLANNQSELSDLALKFKREADPKRKKLLFLQIENTIADLGLAPQERNLRKEQISEASKNLSLGDPRREEQLKQFEDMNAVRRAYSPEAQALDKKAAVDESLLSSQARREYMAALTQNSKPVNTSIPGNVDIGKALTKSDSKVSRLRNIETSAKDDEDKVLKLSDVLVPDLYNQGFKINEKYIKDLTDDDKSNIHRLIRAITERNNIADQELVEQVITNPDGTQYTRLVTAAEDRAQEAADLARIEAERLQKIKDEWDPNRPTYQDRGRN